MAKITSNRYRNTYEFKSLGTYNSNQILKHMKSITPDDMEDVNAVLKRGLIINDRLNIDRKAQRKLLKEAKQTGNRDLQKNIRTQIENLDKLAEENLINTINNSGFNNVEGAPIYRVENGQKILTVKGLTPPKKARSSALEIERVAAINDFFFPYSDSGQLDLVTLEVDSGGLRRAVEDMVRVLWGSREEFWKWLGGYALDNSHNRLYEELVKYHGWVDEEFRETHKKIKEKNEQKYKKGTR